MINRIHEADVLPFNIISIIKLIKDFVAKKNSESRVGVHDSNPDY